MARIYDNGNKPESKLFTDGLNSFLSDASLKRVDFCVGYFNLRGWKMVADKIDTLPGERIYEGSDAEIREHRYCRLLIGMQRHPKEIIQGAFDNSPDNAEATRCKNQIVRDFRQQLMYLNPTAEDEQTLRKLAEQLREKKVVVKLYLNAPLHAKLYLFHMGSTITPHAALMGSSNLTFNGLRGQGELNADFTEHNEGQTLSNWFEEKWNDPFSLDITDLLLKEIDESWAGVKDYPPYYIFLKIAFHLSREERQGMGTLPIPYCFRNELLEFQQNAVKIIVRHLHNDNLGGAMLGDVVGLGKTITACAVAKVFEETFLARTLILCPANLTSMWQKYIDKYDMKATVWSNAMNFDPENTPRFQLVIVDESHNLRNSSGQRYKRIKRLIEYQNARVLLLTATPYNMDFRDLSNQLRLFLANDQDLGIRPENCINAFDNGEKGFADKYPEIGLRTIAAFDKSEDVNDWNDLMRKFLVRRTRTFIKNNYALTDEATGRKYLKLPDGTHNFFPQRLVHTIDYPKIEGDPLSKMYSEEMTDMMEELQLPRYGLVKHISEAKSADATDEERLVIENLSRAGQRMMGFCKSTFFKRIDSSGFAFLLTLYRHILRNVVFIYAIKNRLPLPIGDENELPDEYLYDEDPNASFFPLEFLEQMKENSRNGILDIPSEMEIYEKAAEAYYQNIERAANISWLPSSYFKPSLKKQLLKDCDTLIDMVRLCGKWIAANDVKLQMLEDLLCNKHKGEKVLVFTQYSDTAEYLKKELQSRGITRLECVTGKSDNQISTVERFSPVSNEASIRPEDEINILIATDVLSEGQNLQDSHIIVNYDMPWAIIRLIQRCGRVDRIGQKSQTIDCYSFFPAKGLEDLINLRQRLNDRINENAATIGSDEQFFEGNAQNLLDLYNEKSGLLDDEEDDDVDLGSMAYQIWHNAIQANPALERIISAMPNMVYSTKAARADQNNGVITYAKTSHGQDVLSWVDVEGNVISQSQGKIMKAMECCVDEHSVEPLGNHHELVQKSIDSLQNETSSVSHESGVLGNRLSPRYRIYHSLLYHLNNREADLFFNNEDKHKLTSVIDQIYNHRLKDIARRELMSLLNNRADDDTIARCAIDLYNDDELCHVEEHNNNVQPEIICSMGIRK